MAILNLVLYPDDPLTTATKPFTDFGPRAEKLAADMIETMHAYDGVGLAGPQVGISKQFFVLQEPDEDPMCLINPELSELEGEETGEEGCLSLPEIFGPVPRATRIRVRAKDPSGKDLDFEAQDFLARIIQHETDHLKGVCFIDRVDVLTRQALLQDWEEIRDRLTASVRGR
ncbi:MAG: peptide deformylase [bacterium]|nr:peptide deformylase [bacterium]